MLMDFIGKSHFHLNQSLGSGYIKCRLRRKSLTWPPLKLSLRISVRLDCKFMSLIFANAGIFMLIYARRICMTSLAFPGR